MKIVQVVNAFLVCEKGGGMEWNGGKEQKKQ